MDRLQEIKETLGIAQRTGFDPTKTDYIEDVSYLLSLIEGPMFVVTTDEMDASTNEYDSYDKALECYNGWVETRNSIGQRHRVYLAKVMQFDGEKW